MKPHTADATAQPALVLNRGRLDQLRRAHGIQTEAELARRIGVTPSTLWRVSNGEVTPSNAFIARLILAFPSAPMDSLFSVKSTNQMKATA